MEGEDRNRGLTKAILEILSRHKKPLSSAKIIDELVENDLYPTDECVKVTLSLLKKRGRLYSNQSQVCDDCKRLHTTYGITETGYIVLKNLSAGEK